MSHDEAQRLAYAVVTPARNEVEHLPHLASALAGQSHPPSTWVVVDNGSSDGTTELMSRLASLHPWILHVVAPPPERALRGAASVNAFHRGLASVPARARIVANLDADVSFDADYFAQLERAFRQDGSLGIASGSCTERHGGRWLPRRVTGETVWGAARAYRRECLEAVLPLEERFSWDSLSQLKANALGWETRILPGLAFRHHRPEGGRDGSRYRARRNEGESAWYMGYRWWYLGLRAAHHVARGRVEAVGLLTGYAAAAGRREPRCGDPLVREHLRRHQDPRRLLARLREATGAT